MENRHELLEKFLTENSIAYKAIAQPCYRFQKDTTSARVNGYSVEVAPIESDQFLIRVFLPFRIKKAEMSSVWEEIAFINKCITEGSGFVVDPTDGSVYFKRLTPLPESATDLVNEIEATLEYIEEDTESILMATLEANQAIKEAELAKEEAERRAQEVKQPPSFADRFLSLLGFENKEDEADM